MLKKVFLKTFKLDKFSQLLYRENSYNCIERFIERETSNYTISIQTNILLEKFQKYISQLSNADLAFLLIHSGLIPEHYKPDSSEETFYSKLCEDLIREWSVRIGFTKSYLPTMKSSTEDVTILNDRNELIVCDGKAFRLGRSQAAPNVKDMLKEGDISKWLHPHTSLYTTIGGMVVFPSTHDWKSSTDFYQYTSNKKQPILALNYEHLSYMLIKGITSDFIINSLKNYHEIFPEQLRKKDSKIKNRDKYYENFEKYFFGDDLEFWNLFKEFSSIVINEKCFDTASKLTTRIDSVKASIIQNFNQINDINLLRNLAIKSETQNQTEIFNKQLNNIQKFRKSSSGYYEDE